MKPEKTCNGCGITGPTEELFQRYWNKQRNGYYYTADCKSCRAEEKRDPEYRARKNAARRARYASDPEYRKRRLDESRQWRHGITPEQAQSVIDQQGERCAACGSTEPGGRGRWHADHDHACCAGDRSCGKCFRGFLCVGCNLALGHIGDDPNRAVALADYLLRRVDMLAPLMAGLTGQGQPNLTAGVSRQVPLVGGR